MSIAELAQLHSAPDGLQRAAEAYMTPKQMQDHDEKAVEAIVEDMQREVDELLKDGLSIFRKASHQQRWTAFMQQTDLRDVPTLLAEEPFELLQAGIVPPLKPVIQMLPDGTVQQSNMWPLAYAAGEQFFNAWNREFKTLFRRHAQEQLGADTSLALPPPR